MPDCREHELKIAIAPDRLDEAIAFEPDSQALTRGPMQTRRLVSTYFDTSDHVLFRHGYVLRIRQDGVEPTQCLKGTTHSGSVGTRFEHEVAAPASTPDIDLFGPTVAAELESILEGAPLVAIFTSQIERTVRTIEWHGATIELAADSGEIVAGSKAERVAEFEIELRAGPLQPLFEIGLLFVDRFAAGLMQQSKSERGFGLLGHAPVPCPSEPPELDEAMPTGQAIAAVLQACLDGFVGNWPAIIVGHNADAVHEARVSLRQLRSALSLFGPSLPAGQARSLSDGARRIAAVLGEARNLDVLHDFLREPAGDDPEAAKARRRLMRRIARRRHAAYAEAAARLADSNTARFVLALQLCILNVGEMPNATFPGSIEMIAEEGLAALLGKALKRHKDPARRSPVSRHRLRIALKKLRYAADFFSSLYDEDQAGPYVERLGSLQRDLGELNDQVMIERLIATLQLGDVGRFVSMPKLPGREMRRTLGSLSRDWRRFRKARPFWIARSRRSRTA
ncbi:CYTH and CHAD domain-containing protein [Kaistia dalseonensis]|uniref:Inorganic triphosphatase YgiF n=1 Tax=Kaistia dalseonensis TaxID=410840 RepID=A0ABU0H6F8_9HYPH|nr:CYTH and CHAD domain-containing protein [Kaistia dalseonensis]MCX5495316.1 CYTH and CHAD domain-containing protein [Kaistia dalseonensis]MDQ0437902.1 inorganic triphosphatase YgiF [Kaistia dalseonensis]